MDGLGRLCPRAELAKRAKERFGVKLHRPVDVVRLRWRSLVVPERYPVLTMVGGGFKVQNSFFDPW